MSTRNTRDRSRSTRSSNPPDSPSPAMPNVHVPSILIARSAEQQDPGDFAGLVQRFPQDHPHLYAAGICYWCLVGWLIFTVVSYRIFFILPDEPYEIQSITKMPFVNGAGTLPSLAEVRSSIRRAGLVGNNTVFVHGSPATYDELTFSSRFSPSGAYIQHCLDEQDMEQWSEFANQPWNGVFWQRVAQALAEESWGTIWLLRPLNLPYSNHYFGFGSNVPLFPEHSLPHLMNNQKVVRLMDVPYIEILEDPRDAKQYEVWKRGSRFRSGVTEDFRDILEVPTTTDQQCNLPNQLFADTDRGL